MKEHVKSSSYKQCIKKPSINWLHNIHRKTFSPVQCWWCCSHDSGVTDPWPFVRGQVDIAESWLTWQCWYLIFCSLLFCQFCSEIYWASDIRDMGISIIFWFCWGLEDFVLQNEIPLTGVVGFACITMTMTSARRINLYKWTVHPKCNLDHILALAIAEKG